MLTYKSSYKPSDQIWIGTVLDFPGTIAYGESLERARQNLALALRDMAETNLLQGEALPIPDPTRRDSDADIEEPIHLVLQAGQ
ncbi:MAG: type II toxin-antitoxin system HicB family antitoxin [Planctomycetota bacterium]|nr:type II toxin-antitoxin system HicB family antitoxin [Planctomycetota bacterium]